MPAPRAPAALAAALLAALVLYASLFPFEGWRWPPGQRFTDLLALPWPPWRIPFDLWSNFLGYVPLGVLLALALAQPGRIVWAMAGAALAAAVFSYAIEVAQHFLPERHPSLVDWTLNAAGGALGALLAPPLLRLGWPQRVVRAVSAGFDAGSGGALLLLLLWPLALLFPAPVVLGLGQVGPRLLPLLAEAFDGVPWAAAWHAAFTAAAVAPTEPLGLTAETAVTALGLLAPCLVAFAVARPGWRRALLAVGAAALAVAVLTLSAALNYGPQHAFSWQAPSTLPGLAAGTLLALLLVPLPRRMAVGLGLVATTALVVLVAQAPADPYFAQSLLRWEQGRFIRFHGLAQWIGWLWPYAAGLWLLGRLGTAPTIPR